MHVCTTRSALTIGLLLASAAAASGQTVTSPKQAFGFNIGDDYQLATYTQLVDYWTRLDKESDRMKVVEIGRTEEGRPHLAAIVTAPENLARLDRYKQISQQLHRARGLTDTQARALAKEGKAVVWIDGGLHATEVVGAHQLMETVYQLVSRTDEETTRILRDVIVLAVHANPDGMQMVSKCYMQNPNPTERRTCTTRLYQKYAGHDNNRDFYISNVRETQNMNRFMYWEWLPQIMYNHHQSGPAGTVLFSPPFRDPFNYHFDPMIVTGLDMVGAAMHHRFLQEGKPGFTMRSGAAYSTWWNGGLRTTAYFQNIIGLLTEIVGNPTPQQIPATMNTILPRGDLPAPIAPQDWRFRQSIDYSVTANYAVLDLASRHKDQFLYNVYRMGANQIDRGSRDHWTISNEDMVRLQAVVGPVAGGGRGRGGPGGGAEPAGDRPDPPQPGTPSTGSSQGGRGGRGGFPVAQYTQVLKDPARRDPRVFVIPPDQPDFPTATRFLNALRYVGVEVHQATGPLTAGGRTYPANTYVVKTAQAGRAHVLDMFEPQDHPNDMDDRGVPRRPYDSAGWTLAYQMGITFDRLLDDDVKGPLTEIQGLARTVAGRVSGAGAVGFLLSPAINDSFTIVNRVLEAGGEAYRLDVPMSAGGRTYPVGAFYVAASAAATPIVQKGAAELGLNVDATGNRPGRSATRLAVKRIALWDTPTGSMPSGWVRFLLERFEFPFTIVCGAGFDDTALGAKYDVIIVPSGDGFRPQGGRGGGGTGGGRGGSPVAVAPSSDPDLRSLCQVSTGTGNGSGAEANVRKFVEAGGVVIAAGSAAESVAATLRLPVTEYLIDRQPGQPDRALGPDKFYVPGSVLRVAVDPAAPSAAGAADHVDVFFNNSPVFRLQPDAAARGVRPVMWFDTATPLRSGWAWGQNYLEGGTTAFEATVGQGRAYVFGPEITFRAQPHGTFKFLFNAIHFAAGTRAEQTNGSEQKQGVRGKG